ncbi:hypothetical protein GCM10009560_57960 [Nonomuraea longicatena]|uniref:Uncharacterized protein n=1 Tax=Nonomuraea longicatena TaxID=83682 RepID=A0ABN1QL43_9ACTN
MGLHDGQYRPARHGERDHQRLQQEHLTREAPAPHVTLPVYEMNAMVTWVTPHRIVAQAELPAQAGDSHA